MGAVRAARRGSGPLLEHYTDEQLRMLTEFHEIAAGMQERHASGCAHANAPSELGYSSVTPAPCGSNGVGIDVSPTRGSGASVRAGQRRCPAASDQTRTAGPAPEIVRSERPEPWRLSAATARSVDTDGPGMADAGDPQSGGDELPVAAGEPEHELARRRRR